MVNMIGPILTLVEFANLSSKCATEGEPQVLGSAHGGPHLDQGTRKMSLKK